MNQAPNALGAAYPGVICDLDGVIRRGSVAVPHAVEQVAALSAGVVYATNNASLTPAAVAEQLVGLGLPVRPDQVVTSSQAGAAYLGERLPPGATVLAVGGPGVSEALLEVGLAPAAEGSTKDVAAVLQGYGPQVTATDLAEAAYAIEAGATWVATNRDATLPTQRGVAPGNGALLAAVAFATGTLPTAVGKPERALYDLSVGRLGCARHEVLAIGDRLDTDILGAMAAGVDSLWVLTGVDDLRSFARATGRPRPTYAGVDLRALSLPAITAVEDGDTWSCAGVQVVLDSAAGEVRVTPDTASPESVAWRNALLACAIGLLAHARDEASMSPQALDRLAVELTTRLS